MLKSLHKAWARVQRIDMLTPVPMHKLMVEEIEMLQKERIRAVSKMHRAMSDVMYYDNLLDQLEEEYQTGVRNGELYEEPVSTLQAVAARKVGA